MTNIKLLKGDCLEVMPSIPDNSIDSVVTDPPYGLKFMGKKWDYDVPSVDVWKECLRVLKPGGFLLSFAGTRTQHRMAVNIEDAGFEIRDMIAWVYGSGFPKSLDISKAIDKDNGKGRNLRNFTKWFSEVSKDKTTKEIDDYLGLKSNGATASHYRCIDGQQPRFPRLKFYYKLQKWLGFDKTWDNVIIEAEREVIGIQKNAMSGWSMDGKTKFVDRNITKAELLEAQQWEGWGTALKPATEPLTLAQKPLTVVPLDVMIQANNLIGGLICLSLSSVKLVENLFQLNQNEYAGESVSVQLIAAVLHGKNTGELSEKTDIFRSRETAKITLSIVELWKAILDANYSRQSIFTTSTAIRLTTELRTLNSLILPIMQEAITLEGMEVFGQLLNAKTAEGDLPEEQTNSVKIISVQGLVMSLTVPKYASNAKQSFTLAVSIANTVLKNAITNLEESISPTLEPITVARKPLSESTVAKNVLKWGTGGINIDGSRVEGENLGVRERKAGSEFGQDSNWNTHINIDTQYDGTKGRFPANFIHDGSDEVMGLFPETGQPCGGKKKTTHKNGMFGIGQPGRIYTEADKGNNSAARFFYCAKSSKRERGEGNNHPTVKPIALMQYLVKLVTPSGGTVLDPFMGSGTTGMACQVLKMLNWKFIGIEKDAEYFELAKERIAKHSKRSRIKRIRGLVK